MNIVDIVIVILLLGGLILGYQRGFVLQLISIAGLVISYVAAYFYYAKVAEWLRSVIPPDSFTAYQKYDKVINGFHLDVYIYNVVAFALIFFAVKIVLSWIGHLLDWVTKAPILNLLNRTLGAVLALVEAVIVIIVIVNVMKIIPQDGVQQLLNGSVIAEQIFEHMPLLNHYLHQIWNQNSKMM